MCADYRFKYDGQGVSSKEGIANMSAAPKDNAIEEAMLTIRAFNINQMVLKARFTGNDSIPTEELYIRRWFALRIEILCKGRESNGFPLVVGFRVEMLFALHDFSSIF